MDVHGIQRIWTTGEERMWGCYWKNWTREESFKTTEVLLKSAKLLAPRLIWYTEAAWLLYQWKLWWLLKINNMAPCAHYNQWTKADCRLLCRNSAAVWGSAAEFVRDDLGTENVMLLSVYSCPHSFQGSSWQLLGGSWHPPSWDVFAASVWIWDCSSVQTSEILGSLMMGFWTRPSLTFVAWDSSRWVYTS